MLLVIHDYYSPSEPEGRTGEFASLKSELPFGTGSSLVCFGGPGGNDGDFFLDATESDDSRPSLPEC